MAQRVEKQSVGVAPVEPEGHFFEVSSKMLCRDFVPRSHDAALQERECGFDGVGVNVAINVDLSFVLDRLVTLCEPNRFHRTGIGVELIRHDHVHVRAHIFTDVLRQCSALRVLRMKESSLAASLTDADDDLLRAVGMTRLVLMALVLAADVSFVYFHCSVQHPLFSRRHCCPNPVAEVPGRLIGNTEGPHDLVRTHPLPGLAEQVSCREPFNQWKVGVMKNRVGRHSELVITLFAVQNLGVIRQPNHRTEAPQALRLVLPAETLKKITAAIIG